VYGRYAVVVVENDLRDASTKLTAVLEPAPEFDCSDENLGNSTEDRRLNS
jgi:hypothetical protein